MAISIPSESMKKSLEEAVSYYQKQLNETADGHLAVTYLRLRGITKETAQSFRLGLVKDPLPESGHDFQKDRLAIPYITPTGIVQIRFRAIPYDGVPGHPEPSPKIRGEAGASQTMYNVSAFASIEGVIAICEGEIDTMTAVQAGINAVGIPGANAWQSLYARAFKFRKVVILADNDDHGQGLKFAEKVQSDVRGSRIVLMPEGHDVNSFVVEYGEEELRMKVGING